MMRLPSALERRLGSAADLRAEGSLRRPFRRLIAVTIGPNPSFDYYFAPRLRVCPGLDLREVRLDEGPAALPAGAFADALVLFCRYVTRPWLAAIEAEAGRLAGVALFLDDDIHALVRDASAPPLYRLRLYRRAARHWPRLSRSLDLVLVSTPLLAERHVRAHPVLLGPLPDAPDLAPPPRAADAPFRVAFHDTAAHAAEHGWLRPVVRTVLAKRPDIRFEIAADGLQALRWRSATSAAIVPSRPWPDYRAATGRKGADLLLAPRMPSVANAARSWTKRIDAARAGAALLVSNALVYRPGPNERALGMVVPLEPGRWAEAILALAGERARAGRLAALNRAWVERQALLATPLFEAVPGGDGRWQLAGKAAAAARASKQV